MFNDKIDSKDELHHRLVAESNVEWKGKWNKIIETVSVLKLINKLAQKLSNNNTQVAHILAVLIKERQFCFMFGYWEKDGGKEGKTSEIAKNYRVFN